jgi:two-component system OmpR family response regulator
MTFTACGLPCDGFVKRALVVEDEDDVRAAIVEGLRGEFDVRSARDGVAALGILRYELIDVILLDLRMPGMDGEEFLAAYRHLQRRPPILIATAIDPQGTRAAGMYPVIRKPFDLDSLVRRLNELAGTPERTRTAASGFGGLRSIH